MGVEGAEAVLPQDGTDVVLGMGVGVAGKAGRKAVSSIYKDAKALLDPAEVAAIRAETNAAAKRLPQDIRVSSTPPAALPTDRPIGLSPTQNAAAQSRIRELEAQGYRDIRVNQQQLNARGERCGVCRPDIQATSPTGQRVYIELDRVTSNRGPVHERRLRANDPDGTVDLIQSD